MKFILLSIAAAVLLTFIFTLLFSKKKNKFVDKKPATTPNVDCCGVHEVCEKESLLSNSAEIIYYQDEELDIFRTKPSYSYLNTEIEQFREVLYTMRDSEVAGWLRSLQLRQIAPPDIVREEALMIVGDIKRCQIEN
ncbi:MAG: phospholipase [Bacteroidales bacterium]|jgi:hypothetical protein|nr:phospholipase [Bacteroidales bacterium]